MSPYYTSSVSLSDHLFPFCYLPRRRRLVARQGPCIYPGAKTGTVAEFEMEAAAMRKASSQASLADPDDFDLTRLLNHKPRINVERQRSFDDRSLGELAGAGTASRGGWTYGYGGGMVDSYESMYSPGSGLRSYCGTPASSTRLSFEPHPLIGEAWDALRRSIVSFRGQPIGTIAAVDHSAADDVLNYDQVVWCNTTTACCLPCSDTLSCSVSCVLVALLLGWLDSVSTPIYVDRSRFFLESKGIIC